MKAATAAKTLPTSAWPRIAVAEVTGEVGELVDAGREDDRRREQEREARRVLVVETARRGRRPS